MAKRTVLYVIYMPFTLDEYNIGHLVTTAMISKREALSGTHVEVLENEEAVDEHMGKCQRTVKNIDFSKRAPVLVKSLFPKRALTLKESSWNAFPHCRTLYRSGAFSEEKFRGKVDSLYKEGYHEPANPFPHLPDASRIETIDIAAEAQLEGLDLRAYKTSDGRGEFTEGWPQREKKVITIYKRVEVDANAPLFGGKLALEGEKQFRKIFVQGHQEIVRGFEQWKDMTMEQVRALEERTKKELDEIKGSG